MRTSSKQQDVLDVILGASTGVAIVAGVGVWLLRRFVKV